MALATSGRIVQACECDSSNRTRAGLRMRSRYRCDQRMWLRLCARIRRVDAVDRKILALLTEDARRSYDDIGRRVSLSAPAVKRRVDRLRRDGALLGFTTVVDEAALGASTEALVELFYAPGTLLDRVAETLRGHPEVVEAF